MNEKLLPNHVKPKKENKITYFCKLCRRYDVTERLAHLVNFHKAKQQATSRSGFRELLDIIFVENQR